MSKLESSNAEALVACTLQPDAHKMVELIHQMRKPLKSILFTNGVASAVSGFFSFPYRYQR